MRRRKVPVIERGLGVCLPQVFVSVRMCSQAVAGGCFCCARARIVAFARLRAVSLRSVLEGYAIEFVICK